ncbi:dynein axonemal assembly factor 11-like [Ruditapes philippinarum]|uniref:dynein axonemal assembly factor 11-like n=1 Tax=Ruditapes philippinarum TaxID=129788 RepID=UPI00295BBCF3|nr:dynein axonemal assembly factor 11-like [Ruditapes philippinarum]
MVRITEELVRRKAEHNEREIFSLEELSLHQENIERIENLDKWCRQLKILYLQSNLIPRIENVGRLKKLEYLNLALNNVEVIENLEGCESLKKLDLTVNFVGELTSIECLKKNIFFNELYLTGNPCAQYEGYRDYVIATLPYLKTLDGIVVEKSERIQATQNYGVIKARIIAQQIEYRKQRAKEKEEARLEEEKEKLEKEADEREEKEKNPGYDGRWYTDINQEDKVAKAKREAEQLEKEHAKDKEFWESKSVFSPEERVRSHKKQEEQKDRERKKEEAKNPPKPPRRLFNEEGRALNVNESKIDFKLTEDETGNNYLLDYQCYKYLETSLIDVDVQPSYVRIKTKGKIFQLALDQEVNADSSKCERSKITGHLLVIMPKAKQIVKPAVKPSSKGDNKENVNNKEKKKFSKTHEKLEVDEKARKTVDIGGIVKEKSDNIVPPLGSKPLCRTKVERPNSEDFVDNPDVPPLE